MQVILVNGLAHIEKQTINGVHMKVTKRRLQAQQVAVSTHPNDEPTIGPCMSFVEVE